jgi:hypothetical protein
VVTASSEGKPLEGGSPWTLAGRNKPARHREEKAREGVRNLDAGTYLGEATPGFSGLLVLMASKGRKPHGRGRRRETFRRAAWVIPWRGVKPHERIVAWSQASRQGESKENLRAEQGGLIPRPAANGEEGRAKPMRHYTGSPIILCRGTQPHEGKSVGGDPGCYLAQA